MNQPAICEISNCGVLAIGRCAQCHKAFCRSHQGFKAGGGDYYPLINECEEGSKSAQAVYNAAQKIKSDAQELERSYVPALYERITTVAKLMAEAGVPRLSVRWTEGNVNGKWAKYELTPAWAIEGCKWKESGDEHSGTFRQIGVTTTGMIVFMGEPLTHKNLDTFQGKVRNVERTPHSYAWGYYTHLQSHTENRPRVEVAKSFDKIRAVLEQIARRNGIAIEPWCWPPASPWTDSTGRYQEIGP